jgi:TorA maturation chaperone TorD
MIDGHGTWSDLAELRQGLYRFFAGALLPPDAARVELLGAAAATLAESEFTPAWRAAAAIFEAPPPLGELEAEYAALFVSAEGTGTCPPLEAHYGAAPGRAPLVDTWLRHEYARLGLGLRPDLTVPSDHVSVQLEVMSSLCHDEAHAWADGRDADATGIVRRQWTFLDRHLGRWVPLWASHVEHATVAGPWSTIVAATRAFVQHDIDLVTVLSRSSLVSSR